MYRKANYQASTTVSENKNQIYHQVKKSFPLNTLVGMVTARKCFESNFTTHKLHICKCISCCSSAAVNVLCIWIGCCRTLEFYKCCAMTKNKSSRISFTFHIRRDEKNRTEHKKWMRNFQWNDCIFMQMNMIKTVKARRHAKLWNG